MAAREAASLGWAADSQAELEWQEGAAGSGLPEWEAGAVVGRVGRTAEAEGMPAAAVAPWVVAVHQEAAARRQQPALAAVVRAAGMETTAARMGGVVGAQAEMEVQAAAAGSQPAELVARGVVEAGMVVVHCSSLTDRTPALGSRQMVCCSLLATAYLQTDRHPAGSLWYSLSYLSVPPHLPLHP